MRSWGGKLIVGLLGMLIGGPIGLAIGVLIGHFLDRGVERVQSFNPFRPYRPGEREEVQEALFSAVFSIMGHLAKADGRVSEQEIGQAEAIMSRMQLNDEQRRRAQEAFRQGKDDDFPLDRTVAEFRQRIRRRRHLVVVFLELLLQTALADGELHAEEERILFRVAAGLGVPESQFRQILNMVLAQARFGGAGAAGAGGAAGPSRPSLGEAYQVLGVKEDASDQEVKKAYRRLMSEHHPDKLAARGVPEEMIRVSTEKTAEISKAYDMIKEARGMR
ncbi:co-chaperone DjlA [Alloalcanivorax venustensis]|jgi:DnaJ like chaperone protein|uniref:co-chaperone DjlA n=1 Tax=Alloalcanivorax TaxID=3020832 RepID=UPI000EC06C2B|nr:co-chaperone DjlA [Pseudomonadota bacterium]MTI52603.1 co-chaperone DjlA [Alcanivorax sp.]HCO65376.1 co-chaperone DjlA [Alcanivorax sp.]|tara:strand:+ start:3699 stop:4526 length:828 start_codon:yes stop_codon:yes gene_type:complete